MANHSAAIWSDRVRNRAPADVMRWAEIAESELAGWQLCNFSSVRELRERFVEPAHAYFALAALTRRAVLEDSLRREGLARLFRFRSDLENCILKHLQFNEAALPLKKFAAGESFFGCSKKQGVSVRYPLLTCAPTARCGGGCYAHDGRDRELNQIFRGVLNYYLGSSFENGSAAERHHIVALMGKSLDGAVREAAAQAQHAANQGFHRQARIRLSHVGEMVSTPYFTNMLANQLKARMPELQCVIYTRHPAARLLDQSLIVLNFTIESSDDPRWKYIPEGARIVCSAWNGAVVPQAEVNFLEHHCERSLSPRGAATVCPVTLNHHDFPTCDSARCDKCFTDSAGPNDSEAFVPRAVVYSKDIKWGNGY